MTLTVRDFIQKWRRAELKERSAAQEHFIDLCHLVDHPTPADVDPTGEWFTFEKGVEKSGGGQGWADVWKKDHFAWEYKGNHKDLDAAYQQLLRYHENLGQPPLLVVSDLQRIVIHTKWTNTMPRTYEFTIDQLADETPFFYLRSLFHDPDALHPRATTDKLTEKAAGKFAALAENLRRDYPARDVAHFLTQVVFCLFAEDIRLLPRGPKGETGIFTEIVQECQGSKYGQFKRYISELFVSMGHGGNVLFQDIAHFNGGLFEEEEYFIPELTIEHLSQLYDAARLDWSAVEPSIFGTLFERGLDPDKRAQLGAHYTSKTDIMAIVEPVLMAPLRREWELIQANAEATDDPASLQMMRDIFLTKLGALRVLDPACGSGNFLYVSINLLKDLEKAVIQHPAFDALPPAEPGFVTPAQLHGIEINPYAHELASVVVWIGYIQWFRNNGYPYEQRPILQKLDTIQCKDAILGRRADGTLYKPDWPGADVIIGNPPFLGGKRIRAELGDEYTEALFSLYEELPDFSDLCCYWFEQARRHIMQEKGSRAGLLATQAIRGGANRVTLDRIKQTGDIFFAYSDREWTLEGAAVRVSMIGFDNGDEQERLLDYEEIEQINADLTGQVDITKARPLIENHGIAFIGTQKSGPFDIDPQTAQQMQHAPLNPNGRPNSDVICPWVNATDITKRNRGMWIIDFNRMSIEEAALYEIPFEYVKENVKPMRDKIRRKRHREEWWLFGEARQGMRKAFKSLSRYIITPRVSKHRVMAWVDTDVLPDSATVAIARDDDYFFGVLHAKPHELWALRQGTQLREKSSGNRYTPTTTFQTYPLPWPPGQEPSADPRYLAIAQAAHDLNEKREAWLNPPHAEVATLKRRTLTNLYNLTPEWLCQCHEALDRAVFTAYGWDYDEIANNEEEILRRLLALNLERLPA
jgi:type II restriction/modification system DNA methylase subunit YeeA